MLDVGGLKTLTAFLLYLQTLKVLSLTCDCHSSKGSQVSPLYGIMLSNPFCIL
jgi:uncharacterized Fe-S center protein